MNIFLYAMLGCIILVILISIFWRFLSQKIALPCPSWLGWFVERDNPFAKAAQAQFIIDNLDSKPGMKIIDIGCGPGRVTIPLAQHMGSQGELVAMDIQQEMLERIEQKAKAHHLDTIIYLKAGLGEGKLALNHFDRALLVCVLGEIPNQKLALEEVFKALKPGGILSITETIFDPHFQSKKKVIQLAQAVGFKEKKTLATRLAYTMHLEKPVV